MIQNRAMPLIADGENVVLHSATGSGKTLAFLLPTMQQLRQQEAMQPILRQMSPTKDSPCRPRALVLAPTRDLATQIHKVRNAHARSVEHQPRGRPG